MKKLVKHKETPFNQEFDRIYDVIGSSHLRFFYQIISSVYDTETLLFNLPVGGFIIEGYFNVTEAFGASCVLDIAGFLTFDCGAVGFTLGTQSDQCLIKYDNVVPITGVVTNTPTKGKGILFVLYGENS